VPKGLCTHLTVLMPGKRHRWEFMLMPQDDPAAITQPDRIYELLRPWNIDPAESTIERAVVYTFQFGAATQWRLGQLRMCSMACAARPQSPPRFGLSRRVVGPDRIQLAARAHLNVSS